jgi:hypothetical protein
MSASTLRFIVAVCAGLAAAGCGGRLERAPAAAPAADAGEPAAPLVESPVEGGFSSEAERTRAMEAQAAELQQQYKDSMANAATEEEKLRAYQEFEQGRQELNEIAEDDFGDGDDAYAPPPEP